MVTLDVRPARPNGRATGDEDRTRTRWLLATGAAAAALGAAVAMALLSAVTVLVWASGSLAADGLSAAPFRGAAALWLMGQRAPLDSGTYDLVLPPLAVTALIAVLVARLTGWAARTMSAFELKPAASVVAGVAAGQVVVAGLAGWVSDRAGGGVDTLDAMRAGFLFGTVCAVAGIAPHTWIWATASARWGAQVRTGAGAAGRGALALAAGGGAALSASLVVHHGQVTAAMDVVGGGIGGGVGATLLCLALAPNAVLWVVALAAGPGFALGTDSGLSLTGDMHAGALPAMPLLGALPGPGPLPGYAWLLVAIPVGAGAVIGWYARPATGTRGRREELITAAAAAAVCGVGAGLLAGLSGGGAGGRLETVGPPLPAVGGLLAVELAAAAAALAGGRIAWEYVRAPRPEPVAIDEPTDDPAPPSPLIPAQKTRSGPDGDGAVSTPIEVVDAADVEDLPTGELELLVEDGAGDLEDIEDTQEIPVVPDED
jgi:hypothetical protein